MRDQEALSTFNASKWHLKNTRSSVTSKMDDGIPLSPYDYSTTSKKKKNHRATFEKYNKMHCYSLEIDDDALFKNMSKRPAFVLRPLKPMLNFEVEKLSL